MQIRRSARVAALVLAVMSLQAGCAAPPPPVPIHALPSASPDADRVAYDEAMAKDPRHVSVGLGYWFVAPQEFRRIRKSNPATNGLDSFWYSGKGDTADGIMLWVGPDNRLPTEKTPRATRRIWKKSLAPWMQTVEVVPDTELLDGHEVLHFRGISPMGPKVLDVLVAYVNDVTYKIELNLSVYHSQKQRDAIRHQVVSTWHWGEID